MVENIPLTSKTSGELSVHDYREGFKKGRRGERKGKRESSWVGGKHLVFGEAWP